MRGKDYGSRRRMMDVVGTGSSQMNGGMNALKQATERKLADLRAVAVARGDTELFEMFSENYILGMMCGAYKNATPAALLDRLRKCQQARHELHHLEREMDHSTFRTLVTSGCLVRSGKDKETGGDIFWFSPQELNAAWRVSANSPKGKAYVRAQVWLFESLHVQTRIRQGLGNNEHSMCADIHGGVLEFNPLIIEHVLRLTRDLFPVQCGARVYMFGAPKVIPWIFNSVCRMLPDAASTFKITEDFDDALDIVEDPDDVPEFWICDEASKQVYGNARTSTWCFERCLSDSNKVTTKDVFNAGEWPYKPDEKSSPLKVVENTVSCLDANNEVDEDSDEGW